MARKVREDQLNIRVSKTLRSELESEAAIEARGLSSLIRKILIDHTAHRIAGRMENAA